MVSDTNQPLPAAVSEYMNDRYGAMPSTAMDAVALDEQFRGQIKHYCAVTRYFLYDGNKGCEIPASVNGTTVRWSDVADWNVLESEEASSDE